MTAADRFRAAVEAMDHAAAVATLAEDVVFHSPATFKPFEGRDATAFVLAGVMRVFTNFRYTDQLQSPDNVHAMQPSSATPAMIPSTFARFLADLP